MGIRRRPRREVAAHLAAVASVGAAVIPGVSAFTRSASRWATTTTIRLTQPFATIINRELFPQ